MNCNYRILVLSIVSIVLAMPTREAMAGPADAPDAGRVRLVLPPVIYSVPGIEANVYLDNIVLVLNRANYAFEVRCEKGMQLDERWTFTPQAKDVGEYPLEVIVRDESNEVLARGKSTLRIVSADRKSPRPATLLLVGDSLTDTVYSHYPQRLLALDEKDEALDLKLVGSRGLKNNPPDGPLRHEGYGGWKAETFATMNGTESRKGIVKRPQTGSPFVYDDESSGKPRLNFARYCQEFNDGRGPDAILIVLGANDVFSADDQTIDEVISKSLGFFDELIREFHSVRADTRIGVGLTPPSSCSQDGFRNYRGVRKQTRWQFRRNQHRLVERIAERYANREAEQLYVVPAYLNLDTVRNFTTWQAPPNAHATEAAVRVNDGVHPSEQGHYQLADTFYCWLKTVTNAAN